MTFTGQDQFIQHSTPRAYGQPPFGQSPAPAFDPSATLIGPPPGAFAPLPPYPSTSLYPGPGPHPADAAHLGGTYSPGPAYLGAPSYSPGQLGALPPRPTRSLRDWWIGAAVVGVVGVIVVGLLIVNGSSHHAGVASPAGASTPSVGPASPPASTPASSPSAGVGGVGGTGSVPVAAGGDSGGAASSSGSAGGAAAVWPRAFAPFSALLGSGPGDSAAWQQGRCVSGTPSSASIVATVSCTEAGGITVTALQVTSPTVITGLVQSDQAKGAAVAHWSYGSGSSLGQTITSADGSEIITTFDAYPTILIDLQANAGVNVKSAWTAAPFPH